MYSCDLTNDDPGAIPSKGPVIMFFSAKEACKVDKASTQTVFCKILYCKNIML